MLVAKSIDEVLDSRGVDGGNGRTVSLESEELISALLNVKERLTRWDAVFRSIPTSRRRLSNELPAQGLLFAQRNRKAVCLQISRGRDAANHLRIAAMRHNARADGENG